MDGFGSSENVVVLAATNRVDILDPALTRPGRFDRIIEIQLPNIEEREEIFSLNLKKFSLDPTFTIDQYARKLAILTGGFSGSAIRNLCNESAIRAAREDRDHVTEKDFEKTTERILAGLENQKVQTLEEKKIVAVHESGHALVSWFLEGADPLVKLTIIPRTNALGFTQYLHEERNLSTPQ